MKQRKKESNIKLTWRDLIKIEMNIQNDSFDNLINCSIPLDDLDNFANRTTFLTLWTTKRVYIPVYYSSEIVVISALRNPN